MTLLNELMTLICQEPWAKAAPKDLPFIGGLLGYYGYESGHFVEQLPDTVKHDIPLDTLSVGLYAWAVIHFPIKKKRLSSSWLLGVLKKTRPTSLTASLALATMYW